MQNRVHWVFTVFIWALCAMNWNECLFANCLHKGCKCEYWLMAMKVDENLVVTFWWLSQPWINTRKARIILLDGHYPMAHIKCKYYSCHLTNCFSANLSFILTIFSETLPWYSDNCNHPLSDVWWWLPIFASVADSASSSQYCTSLMFTFHLSPANSCKILGPVPLQASNHQPEPAEKFNHQIVMQTD